MPSALQVRLADVLSQESVPGEQRSRRHSPITHTSPVAQSVSVALAPRMSQTLVRSEETQDRAPGVQTVVAQTLPVAQ